VPFEEHGSLSGDANISHTIYFKYLYHTINEFYSLVGLSFADSNWHKRDGLGWGRTLKFETVLKKSSWPFKISPVFIWMARVKHEIFKENQQGNRNLYPLSK
jgi:hypothetical protein